jgi:hypothetical protein
VNAPRLSSNPQSRTYSIWILLAKVRNEPSHPVDKRTFRIVQKCLLADPEQNVVGLSLDHLYTKCYETIIIFKSSHYEWEENFPVEL